MLRRSQGLDSRVTLSQSKTRIVPLLALTTLPSFLALKTTAQNPMTRARLYVTPKG